MDNIFKKTLKISLILFIVNLVVSGAISLIIGENRFLKFVSVGRGGYDIKGIFASSFFFIIAFIVYVFLFLLMPLMMGWITKKIDLSYKSQKSFSGIYGSSAKEDIEKNPGIYFKKVVSSMFIFVFFLLIFINILLLEQIQNLFVTSSIFGFVIMLVVVTAFFVFSHIIYKIF